MSSLSTTNIGLYSVPAGFLLCMLPHWYAIRLLSKNSGTGGFDNTNPRNQGASLQGKLSAADYGKWQRAEAAQQNGFDSLPLFASAVGIASLARVPAQTVNNLSVAYLASRALYNILYINTTDNAKAGIRSLTWLFGIGTLLTLLVKAGQNINATIL